jgi:hypothetical protein
MALAGGHVAVHILRACAALARNMLPHALDFFALDLRFGLRDGSSYENQE